MTNTAKQEEGPPIASVAELLSEIPPGRQVRVKDAVYQPKYTTGLHLQTPEILLWCDADTCNGYMLFECVEEDEVYVNAKKLNRLFIDYRCKHCEKTRKTFSLLTWQLSEDIWVIVKLGEWRPYGPHVPPRLLRLIQNDVHYLLQGRRAEGLGLGIGAFAYYRRVVENQKDRLFERIVSVAKRVGARPEDISALGAAKQNFQFSKSVEDFKHLLPQSLLIKGHNPLLLLHTALSKGIHNDSDSECLCLATDIRIVLTELGDRISQALKDDDELNQAVARLMRTDIRPERRPTEGDLHE